MSTNKKWILAVIAAAVIGGGTVATLDSSDSKLMQVFSPEKGCEIKGNISSSGEKIYHVPGQSYYIQTKIDKDAGEKWFCSEQEAKEAGWRKAKV